MEMESSLKPNFEVNKCLELSSVLKICKRWWKRIEVGGVSMENTPTEQCKVVNYTNEI